MRFVGVLGVLACCGPSSAIEVVVEMPHGDPNLVVDEVQLYVGLGEPLNERKDANGQVVAEVLIPRGYGPNDSVPKGFYWKRDVPSSPDQDRAKLDGDDVHFTFQPGTHDRITVIAVGYAGGQPTAAAALVDAKMESGTVRQYHVTLAPATSPFGATRGPVTLQEWGPLPDARDCVHYRDLEQSIYIVAHHDRDCDGRIENEEDPAKNECRVSVFDGYRRPDRLGLSCVTQDQVAAIGTGKGPCVLGGGCAEAPTTPACAAPGATCVEPVVCARCLDNTGMAANPLDCITDIAMPATTSPHIDCTMYFTRGAGVTFCGSADLGDTIRFSRVGATCDTNQPYLFYVKGSGKWQPAFEAQGITFTAAKPTAACDFSLTATPGVSAQAMLDPIQGIVSGTTTNGRSAAYPISISFVDAGAGCDNMLTECKFAGDPLPDVSFKSCMMKTVVDPW